MTGYTVHTGSNEKFRDGWDRIFKSGKKPRGTGSRPESTKKTKAPKKK